MSALTNLEEAVSRLCGWQGSYCFFLIKHLSSPREKPLENERKYLSALTNLEEAVITLLNGKSSKVDTWLFYRMLLDLKVQSEGASRDKLTQIFIVTSKKTGFLPSDLAKQKTKRFQEIWFSLKNVLRLHIDNDRVSICFRALSLWALFQ